MYWQTSRRKLDLSRPLVMAIINATPDSFSDGGKFFSVDSALEHTEKVIREGADMIDIGGESTRPGSTPVTVEEEIRRVVPLIDAISRRFNVPVSIDTTKAKVALAAVEAGAEIINDISGLRFDSAVAEVAAKHRSGLVLMHSLGMFETMHRQEPTENILDDVSRDFVRAAQTAISAGVRQDSIVLDIGIGFGKSHEQNLELIAKLDKIVEGFPEHPIMVGASRKSFIGNVLGGSPVGERTIGSIASVAVAVWNGASIVRVHDVKETVEAVRIVEAIRRES
ncbi:MAG: dihydropteroate synthase [Pyrinomonadaceae bacterium]